MTRQRSCAAFRVLIAGLLPILAVGCATTQRVPDTISHESPAADMSFRKENESHLTIVGRVLAVSVTPHWQVLAGLDEQGKVHVSAGMELLIKGKDGFFRRAKGTVTMVKEQVAVLDMRGSGADQPIEEGDLVLF